MKPVIGITVSLDETLFKLGRNYSDAITAAGGTPLALTYPTDCDGFDFERLMDICDGFLFSGGGDIQASYFDEEPHPKADLIFPERDEFEITLCKKALARNKPILGICRGIQLLNVASGGSLVQHIEDHWHMDKRGEPVHPVEFVAGTKISRIYGKSLTVNSIHHQALNVPGKDLIVSAKTADGIIEAVEHTGKRFVVGVQWHPETLFKNYAEHFKIFEEFLRNA